MNTPQSKRIHWLIAGIVMLGITTAAYANHCFSMQLNGTCGTDQVIPGLDCSYLTPEGELVSCTNQTLYIITAAPVHKCVDKQNSGKDGCNSCGAMVQAERQKYKCKFPGSGCTITEDGPPTPYGLPCCTATLFGDSCSHPQ